MMADDTPPWFIKTTHTAPKPMSIHAFKMALLQKRLAVGSAADEDAPMIKAELNATSNKRMQKELMEKYANAAEDAEDTKEAAVRAREKSEQLRREYKDEKDAIRQKGTREQETRAKALQDREAKRAEQKRKLQESVSSLETKRTKNLLSLKQVLNDHKEAKRSLEDAPPAM